MAGGRTTYMESTHGQLCTRFTNGLGSNYTHRFTLVYAVTASQVTAITFCANTTAALACQHGTDLDLLKTGVLNTVYKALVDFLIGLNQHLSCDRIKDIIQGHTPKDTVADVLNNFATLGE